MERKHDEKKAAIQKPQLDEQKNQQKKKESMLLNLQHKAGNQAVQRLIAQHKSEEGFDLDDKTTAKIQQARSGGQALERSFQRQMETKFGKSLDDVKLHTCHALRGLGSGGHLQRFENTGRDGNPPD